MLEDLVEQFSDSHPYEVEVVEEGRPRVRAFRLRFTSKPDPTLALVVGDFLYNVRSGLDHLAASLVPAANRRSVMFPILREAVWTMPHEEGEAAERTRARERWQTCTRGMKDEAVAIIIQAQPVNLEASYPNFHVLDVLNRLSNRDKHERLTVVSHGLCDVACEWRTPSGELIEAPSSDSNLKADEGLKDGAKIHVPENAVAVELHGATTLGVPMGPRGEHVEIPLTFRELMRVVRENLALPLAPYLHGLPS